MVFSEVLLSLCGCSAVEELGIVSGIGVRSERERIGKVRELFLEEFFRCCAVQVLRLFTLLFGACKAVGLKRLLLLELDSDFSLLDLVVVRQLVVGVCKSLVGVVLVKTFCCGLNTALHRGLNISFLVLLHFISVAMAGYSFFE